MINVSSAAATKITELLTEEQKLNSGLRVFVQGGGCSGFQYGLMIEESGGDGDQVFESNGVKLYVDPISIRYLKGAEVDFVETVTGRRIHDKNRMPPPTCGCGSRSPPRGGGGITVTATKKEQGSAARANAPLMSNAWAGGGKRSSKRDFLVNAFLRQEGNSARTTSSISS